MDAIALNQLIEQCAVGVAPTTMAAIVKVESGGNPYAIGDNTSKSRVSPTPKTAHEAATIALDLLRKGHSLDLGLAQINSNNLKGYKVSVQDIFEPCTNLKVGSKILSTFYTKSAQVYGHGDISLFHALSAYNTGSFFRGPGYVEKILNAAGSKASTRKVSWSQASPKSTKKSAVHHPQQRYTLPMYAPIIAFSHIESSDNNSSSNDILTVTD